MSRIKHQETKTSQPNKTDDSTIKKKKIIEMPENTYEIKAENLKTILLKHGINEHQIFADILTDLEKYRVYEIPKKPKPLKCKSQETHLTTQNFKTKIVRSLFYIPKTKRYEYLRIKIAPSTIKAAGMGAYAVDPIPKGAKCEYKGVKKVEEDANLYYAWTIKTFDKDTGEPDDRDLPLYYVDATDLRKSNWTRYANCGMKSKDNNMDSEQEFANFYYVAMRDIKPGEEIFIDYGEEYRKFNLGMKGKY